MKARQLELRAIPQFDSGRWKLRLEVVPHGPNNENMMAINFDSAAQARVNETNEAHWFPLAIERGRRERQTSCRTNRAVPAIIETGANNSKPVPAESFKPMITR
jgi:hypothetical protein